MCEMNKAFKLLKTKLTEQPILYAPDYNSDFVVQTDVLKKGANSEEPIIFLSQKFTVSGRNFKTSEQECATIIFTIKQLRHYIDR